MIVVLGLYRGGSSTVAGMLSHLGACLGHELKLVPTTDSEGPGYCTYEDWPLRRAFLRCYQEPSLDPLAGFDKRVDVLRRYLHRRLAGVGDGAAGRSGRSVRMVPKSGCKCDPIAVKFPGLCYMGPEMVEAWGADQDITFVSVERDPETVWKSLRRWYPGHARQLTERLIRAREAFLSGRDHVTIQYEEILQNPAESIRHLVQGVGELDPTEHQLEDAGAFICRPTGQGVVV